MLPGVILEGGEVLPADAAVLAMGPWTSEASAWLNGAVELGITGHKYHSVVLRPTEEGSASAHCLFTSFKHTSGREGGGDSAGHDCNPGFDNCSGACLVLGHIRGEGDIG